MIKGTIKSDLEALNRSLAEYLPLTSKSRADALEHQGQKLRYALYRGFRGIKADRGEIEAEAYARMKRGEGTEVRPSIQRWADQQMKSVKDSWLSPTKTVVIKGRKVRLTRQQMAVRRELGARQRGSGYLGVSWIFRGWSRSRDPRTLKLYARARGGWKVARVAIDTVSEDATIQISNTLEGVGATDEKHQIVRRALRTVDEDIRDYLHRKYMQEVDRNMKKHLRKGAKR